MKVILSCFLFAVFFFINPLMDSTQPFRTIPIPKRENGYSNFASVAFVSRAALDSFLADMSTKRGWNNRQGFEDALLNAKVDFSKEALVLLRHSETSGSVQVTFETPTLKDRTLLCEIRGKPLPPGHLGTADMADYCFALAVSKAQVSQVELQAVQGGFSARRLAPIVLPLIEKQPGSTPSPSPVKETEIQDCPTISVSCPDEYGEDKSLTFQANVTGGKPRYEVLYNWSVSKGTISQGQGTPVIRVDVTGVNPQGITATVEVNGFDPNCNRVASCSITIP